MFQRFFNAIVYIMKQHGSNMVAYIDNYVGIASARDIHKQF